MAVASVFSGRCHPQQLSRHMLCGQPQQHHCTHKAADCGGSAITDTLGWLPICKGLLYSSSKCTRALQQSLRARNCTAAIIWRCTWCSNSRNGNLCSANAARASHGDRVLLSGSTPCAQQRTKQAAPTAAVL